MTENNDNDGGKQIHLRYNERQDTRLFGSSQRTFITVGLILE